MALSAEATDFWARAGAAHSFEQEWLATHVHTLTGEADRLRWLRERGQAGKRGRGELARDARGCFVGRSK